MAYMIILPGVIALLGWNKAVQILTPINAILFINFAPVTTIVIRVIQGHEIGTFEIIGVALVILSIIANNMYQRYVNNKIEDQHEVEPTKHKSINRSEEHTSELQSRGQLVCRLLLENKSRRH